MSKITFYKDNLTKGAYNVDVSTLVDEFYSWARDQGGLGGVRVIRQVRAFMALRSDGKDSWDPEETDVLFDAIRDDPRWKDESFWRGK